MNKEVEPGRKFTIESLVFSRPAKFLAEKKVPADLITLIGAGAGVLGSYFLCLPENARDRIARITKDRFIPSIRQVKAAGGVLLGFSYLCDLQDGEVARQSPGGPTRFGRVLDGVVNKMVDTSSAVFLTSNAKTFDDWATWKSYLFLAPISTMIRSIGIQHDIGVSKTGICARVGRIPVLALALLYPEHRNKFGKILSLQVAVDSLIRYQKIASSGDQEALDQISDDLREYSEMALFGETFSKDPFKRELGALAMELAKLTQVITKEAYG